VNRLVFIGLMMLVVLCPLPLGSNREWSWSLCALVSALLAVAWVSANFWRREVCRRHWHPWSLALFLMVCLWALLQIAPWMPESWKHPLWGMTGDALGRDLPGSISLAAEDTWTALLRLQSYALVFVLAYLLGADRGRAQAAFGWLALAGLVYALFALSAYWSGHDPVWLFGGKVLAQDVHGTFINRNHFATWQGLTILCVVAYFYQRMSRPAVKPYAVPQNRDADVEEFILRAWQPLTALLLMVTALVLTHSRGGFSAALAGTLVLLLLLDRRAPGRRTLSRVTVIAALIVASIAFYLTSAALLDRIDRTDISSEERLTVFANVNRGIAANPALGFGYGTFADSFRLYDRNEDLVHYDRAHNTWLENAFELGLPAALALFLAIAGLALTCLRGVHRRRRDWVFPATGAAASVLVGVHATVDFSLQIPAVAFLYACIMGVACAQSRSTKDY
jgi:hypothetical protein